jgi:hypothetical protein
MKTGTGILFMDYEERTRVVYRYATDDEIKDKNITKYTTKGKGGQPSRKIVKYVQTMYAGPNFYPVSRDDFVISSDADNIEDAYMAGFCKDYRFPELQSKVNAGRYYQDEFKKISSPQEYSENQEVRAKMAHKELEKTDLTKPIKVWSLWLSYDVDEDGEEDSICVVIHKETGAILKAIYNPIFSGFKPFQELIFNPVEFQFDGEGTCEILEHIQVAVDTIINQRIDRMTQINGPLIFIRKGEGLDNYKLAPGKVEYTDANPDDVVKLIEFPDVYFSTFQEEDRLVAAGDRAIGITPASLGIQTSERPVFKESMARLQEANRKFANGIRNVLNGVGEAVTKAIEMFAQYQPSYSYKTDASGEMKTITVDFPVEFIRDGLKIETYASSELINEDILREINMAVYQLISDYMTKNAGMVQAIVSPEVPSSFKQWLIAQYDVGIRVIKRILEDFDIPDVEELTVALEEVMNLDKVVSQSIDIIQEQQMAMGVQPQPPQGQQGGQGQPQGQPPMQPGM